MVQKITLILVVALAFISCVWGGNTHMTVHHTRHAPFKPLGDNSHHGIKHALGQGYKNPAEALKAIEDLEHNIHAKTIEQLEADFIPIEEKLPKPHEDSHVEHAKKIIEKRVENQKLTAQQLMHDFIPLAKQQHTLPEISSLVHALISDIDHHHHNSGVHKDAHKEKKHVKDIVSKLPEDDEKETSTIDNTTSFIDGKDSSADFELKSNIGNLEKDLNKVSISESDDNKLPIVNAEKDTSEAEELFSKDNSDPLD